MELFCVVATLKERTKSFAGKKHATNND